MEWSLAGASAADVPFRKRNTHFSSTGVRHVHANRIEVGHGPGVREDEMQEITSGKLWLICTTAAIVLVNFPAAGFSRVRFDINDNWRTVFADPSGAEQPAFGDGSWEEVRLPHNHSAYHKFRGIPSEVKTTIMTGTCWYRRHLSIGEEYEGKRVFCVFESICSYGEVYINGTLAGEHKGGRTIFPVDITDHVHFGGDNVIAVKVWLPDLDEHPFDIPWIDPVLQNAKVGSDKLGHGAHPLGMARPAHVLITDPVRVEHFGTYVWCDSGKVSSSSAEANIRTEVRSYENGTAAVTVKSEILDAGGTVLAATQSTQDVGAGQGVRFEQKGITVSNPHLWSLDDCYLHTLRTTLVVDGQVRDTCLTSFGFRSIRWPRHKWNSALKSTRDPPYFTLNGKHIPINGANIWETQLGTSFAFCEEQIYSDILKMKTLGFNFARLDIYPTNIRYLEYCDKLGVLAWPEFSCVTPDHEQYSSEFGANYKNLIRDFVRERRNNPSVVLYDIQNESSLSSELGSACNEIIREEDPTCPGQRATTMCHWGREADFAPEQCWFGTYGNNYKNIVGHFSDSKGNFLGEYGVHHRPWVHYDIWDKTDGTPGPLAGEEKDCEEYVTDLLEHHLRSYWELRNSICGACLFVFRTLLNGRDMRWENMYGHERNRFRVGPRLNPKGILTCWDEPLDAAYMYQAHTTPSSRPVVVINSHTWPDRWSGPGTKDNVIVYSNCDKVELFNDYKGRSLGVKDRVPYTRFEWDGVDIQHNVLYAEGKVGGNVVASDIIVLDNLPEAPNLKAFDADPPNTTEPVLNNDAYRYRLNCAGAAYTDVNGNTWEADRRFEAGQQGSRGSVSWIDEKNYTWYMDDCRSHGDDWIDIGSKAQTFDPIRGTGDDVLYQTARFGRELNSYRFPVDNGLYLVELHFAEPWYGTGSGDAVPFRDWRKFDVAVEGKVVLDDFDIWAEAGHDKAVRKVMYNNAVTDGMLDVTFPEVKINQALLAAVAIARQESVSVVNPLKQPGFTRFYRTAGRFGISFNEAVDPHVQLVTVSGRVVYQRRFSRRTQVAIPLSTLPSGVYVLRIALAGNVMQCPIVCRR